MSMRRTACGSCSSSAGATARPSRGTSPIRTRRFTADARRLAAEPPQIAIYEAHELAMGDLRAT
jgi:hypothetical protein